ncbi:MAG TPA: MFS transporter [Acidimicrobiales bacterium]|nr:MFS transporter [Acidimicrobiales bacterium]
MSSGSATRRGSWTLVATGLGLFMIFLDAMIVNVAIPDIQREFGASETGIQWVVAAYSLTMAMFIMSGATFGDHSGRRLAYIGGIVVFCVASVACGFAPGIAMLIVARGFQGVGAALVNVASLALVGAAFPDPKTKAKAIGIWTGIAAVGLAIGPTLGGVLTEDVGWRSIFLFNPFIGALAIWLTLRFVSESRDPASRSFDVPGQLLYVVGVGLLTYALIQGDHAGWLSPIILGSFAVAAVVTVTFVRYELHASDPMMDMHVFRNKVYDAAIYAVFATLFSVYGTLFIITQYFQNVRTYSPERSGVLILAMTIPTIVLSPLTGRIVAARGARSPTLLGLGCLAIGTGLLAAGNAKNLSLTLIALMFVGAASGLSVAAATSEAMAAIPPERSGMASGILSSQRALGSTAGFAIMGSVLAATVSIALPRNLEAIITDPVQRDQVAERVVDDANPQAVASLIGPGKPLPDNVTEDDAVVAAADDAFISGIRVAMLVGFFVGLSALVVGWRLFPREEKAPIKEIMLEPG